MLISDWVCSKQRPLTQDDGEVLAHHPDWIDEDFNPKGIRIGFVGGEGNFISAYWWDYQDTYIDGEEHDGEDKTPMPTYYLIPADTENLPKVQ